MIDKYHIYIYICAEHIVTHNMLLLMLVFIL